MPYVSPEAQREAARKWMHERRQEWLDAHPCACGQPSTSVMSLVPGGVPKGAFSARAERRVKLLANTITLCESCRADRVRMERAATRARSLERQRVMNREYMRRRRASQPKLAKVGKPVSPPSQAEKPARKREKKITLLAPMDQVSEFERRRARRRWREERRARLGYALPSEPSEDNDED